MIDDGKLKKRFYFPVIQNDNNKKNCSSLKNENNLNLMYKQFKPNFLIFENNKNKLKYYK